MPGFSLNTSLKWDSLLILHEAPDSLDVSLLNHNLSIYFTQPSCLFRKMKKLVDEIQLKLYLLDEDKILVAYEGNNEIINIQLCCRDFEIAAVEEISLFADTDRYCTKSQYAILPDRVDFSLLRSGDNHLDMSLEEYLLVETVPDNVLKPEEEYYKYENAQSVYWQSIKANLAKHGAVHEQPYLQLYCCIYFC